MNQATIVLGAMRIYNKKMVPASRSLKSKYKIRGNRWRETGRVRSTRKQWTILVSMIGRSLSTPAANLCQLVCRQKQVLHLQPLP